MTSAPGDPPAFQVTKGAMTNTLQRLEADFASGVDDETLATLLPDLRKFRTWLDTHRELGASGTS